MQKRAKTLADGLDNSDDEESANGSNIFDRYEDVSWIPATSVECERFFSTVGLVFTQRRKSMQPTTLEMILFYGQTQANDVIIKQGRLRYSILFPGKLQHIFG